MVEKGKPKAKARIIQTAGKSIKIWDQQLREEGKPKIQERSEGMLDTEMVGSKMEMTIAVGIDVGNQEGLDSGMPSITHKNVCNDLIDNLSLFPIANTDMVGMDQSIYDFCGNLPLGPIQEEGGYLLQDVVNSCVPKEDKIILNIDDDIDDEADMSFKSTQSRSSMIQKMNNMTVRKEDVSMSDSDKRKHGDADDDTTSSAMKRLKKND